MAFNTKLNNLLKSDSRFVDDDGELILAAVQDAAWKVDRNLVKLLLSDPEIKAVFFEEIEGHWIFDVNKFIDYTAQKNFLDNSYTRFKNRIGLTIGGRYLRERGEVALVWPYKDCYLEGGQTKEEEKRKEIFFNEVLAQDEINRLLDPKVLTNFKRYTANSIEPVTGFRRDENGVIRENLIIKGNNLLALHTLKTQFRGQVKLIYIDPPYNTGNDSFGYNDSFNHSTWLTFMKNRLEVARELLRSDGVIFISCDDNEQAYLKVLCDEVFGRDNFIATMPWKGRGGRQDAEHVADIHEFVVFYAKDRKSFIAGSEVKENERYPKFDSEKNRFYKTQLLRKWGSNSRREDRPNLYYAIYSLEGDEIYPKLPDGSDGCWRWGPNRMQKEIDAGNIEFVKQNDGTIIPYQKIYAPLDGEQRTKKFTSWIEVDLDFWLDSMGTTADGSKEVKNIFGYKAFDYPKPTSLIKHLFKIGNLQDDDIVLDFFPGSGTTAHAAITFGEEEGISINFILCEQMDYIETVTRERISRVMEQNGNGDFIYCELMKYNEAFMERIQAAKSSDELVLIWREMAEGSFLNWYVNPAMPEEAIRDFEAIGKEPNGLEKQKRLLAELLDKNQLYVNLSEIDDAQFDVSEEDKALNRAFYGEWYNA
jgi:adenine-specific DNA-methyltransferase